MYQYQRCCRCNFCIDIYTVKRHYLLWWASRLVVWMILRKHHRCHVVLWIKTCRRRGRCNLHLQTFLLQFVCRCKWKKNATEKPRPYEKKRAHRLNLISSKAQLPQLTAHLLRSNVDELVVVREIGWCCWLLLEDDVGGVWWMVMRDVRRQCSIKTTNIWFRSASALS